MFISILILNKAVYQILLRLSNACDSGSLLSLFKREITQN
jgi:hypothetical protein